MGNENNLENLQNKIKEYAESKEIKVIEGFFVREVNQVISRDKTFVEFLDWVADSKNKLIVLDVQEFNESFFEPENLKIIERSERIDEIKDKYKGYIGKPLRIKIGWLNEGFVIVFEETANWFEGFINSLGELEQKEDEEKFSVCKECGEKFRDFRTDLWEINDERLCIKCQTKKQKEAEEIIKEVSYKLAEDDNFAECKNPAEREIYLEKNYPGIVKNEFVSIYKLSQRAKAIRDIKKRGV